MPLYCSIEILSGSFRSRTRRSHPRTGRTACPPRISGRRSAGVRRGGTRSHMAWRNDGEFIVCDHHREYPRHFVIFGFLRLFLYIYNITHNYRFWGYYFLLDLEIQTYVCIRSSFHHWCEKQVNIIFCFRNASHKFWRIFAQFPNRAQHTHMMERLISNHMNTARMGVI